MSGVDITPGSLGASFRQALRGFAATVNVISTNEGNRRYGMTATAVMSLSLHPPSLVVAVNQSASMHEPLRHRKAFCVNVLSERHDGVGRDFALKRNGEERFGSGAWAIADHADPLIAGLPYLADAQASVFCGLASEFPFGSHTLLVGTVLDIRGAGNISPLLYCDGCFGSFAMRSEPNPEALRSP